jgi:hypothetical protein
MGFEFRPAIRENVGLLIGLTGPSGGGKTMTAFRLAKGIAGDKPFAVIDTEARRALHYADMFNFHHAELKAPFRPDAYADAITAADRAGYPVIVVDSGSHEWVGEGGVLDWQEEELEAAVKRSKAHAESKNWNFDEYKARESNKMAAWIKPKMAHKQMVQRLLQVRAHLIICLRAEEKIEMSKDEKGKTTIIPKGWQPVCAKDFPFELTASFLLTPDAPGVPKPIKLQEQHRALFPLDQPITEDSGRQIAKWAHGGAAPAAKAAPGIAPETKAAGEAAAAQGVDKYTAWLAGLDPAVKETVRPFHKDWSARAKAADEAAKSAAPRPWSFQPEQGAVMPCNSAAEFATLMQATIPGDADIGLLMGYNAAMLDRLDEIEPERYAAIVAAATQKGWVG